MGILVHNLGRGLGGDIVDAAGLIPLAIGIHHWSVVPLMAEAFFLKVPHFVAVSANDVRVPGAAGTGINIVVSGAIAILFRGETVVVGTDSGNLLDLLLSEVIPDDVIGFFWLKLSFDGSNSL